MNLTILNNYQPTSNINSPVKRINLEFLRHPLASVFFGFILTGLLGAGLSDYFLSKQKEKELKVLVASENKKAINEISRRINARRVRSELLSSSFRRDAPLNEIIERKKLYDEAYAEWGTNIQVNLLVIRNILKSPHYTNYENYLEKELVDIFREIDSCLTQAYDEKIKGGNPLPLLADCKVASLIQKSLDCSYAIIEGLYVRSELLAQGEKPKLDNLETDKEVIKNCATTIG